MNDIITFEDVKLLVDTFYARAKEDELIGPIFVEHLKGKWEAHHERLYQFWNTVILREPDYYGKPVPMHFKMELSEEMFGRWLVIWEKTVDDLFEGKHAGIAKHRGKTMANAFWDKLK